MAELVAPQGANTRDPGENPGVTMNFAVIKTGGKQYKVAANDVIKIEKLEAEAGDVVIFDQVLMLGGDAVAVGSPLIEGASVAGHFLATEKQDTVIILKKHRRQHFDRRNGHRQRLSLVRIGEILMGGAKPTLKADEKLQAKAAAKAEAAQAVTEKPAKKAAAPKLETKAKAEKAPTKPKAEKAAAPVKAEKAPAKAKAKPKAEPKTEAKAKKPAAPKAAEPAAEKATKKSEDKKPAAKKAAPKADKE